MCLVHLDDTSLFWSHERDAKGLVVASDSRMRHPIILPMFNAKSICNFEKKMLPANHTLHDPVNRQKATDGAEPVSFSEVLNFTLEKKLIYMYQGVMGLQQHVNGMYTFICKATEKSQLWKRKNEGHLEKAMELTTSFSFAGANNLLVFMIIAAPSAICR